MRKILNKILILVCLFFITITLSNKVNAESFSANKSTVNIGENFTVTISGINGKVTVSGNDKVSLSNSGTMWVTGQTTIQATATKEGTGTVTIKLVDATTTGANPKDLSGTTKSVNIAIKKKEEVKQETPVTTNKTTPTTNSNNTQNNNKKANNSSNKTAKTETKKEVTPVVETKEQEEATPQFGINSLKLIGITELEERVDLNLDKEFNINTYEYSCNIPSNIKKIEIQKDATPYNDFIKINGLEEELKAGENVITLKMVKEGENELTYTIKINKEETKDVTAPIEEETRKEKQPIMVSMPLGWFIVLQIAILAVEVVVTKVVIDVVRRKRNTHKIHNK